MRISTILDHIAGDAGFRCFTSGESFRDYVQAEVISGGVDV